MMNIDKKILTKLYNLNQDLKNVFDTYYVIIDDMNHTICISLSKLYGLKTGEHYAIVDSLYIPNVISKDISIDSNKLFKFFSSYKKYITGLDIRNENIIFEYEGITKNELEFSPLFGNTYSDLMNSSIVKNHPYNNHSNIINNFSSMITITENEVIDLVKNSYMFLNHDKYSVRITRELIPGLKKTHKVNVMFRDLPDSRIFECIIKVERATATTFHIYKCLFI